jgi:hypothetical protein
MEVINQNVEVVVHIRDKLDAAARDELVAEVESRQGIYSALFCPIRYHLMLIQYERDRISSQDVIRLVSELTPEPRLIGPI